MAVSHQTISRRKKQRADEINKLNNVVQMKVVEEEPKPDIIKEKKEVKRSKSWGRRSTRTKKSISYRSGTTAGGAGAALAG